MQFNKTMIASIFGNTLEWYDFVLYGSLTPYIAATFFPNKSLFISLMLTFGTFAAGFLMRPLGGLVYGVIGDRYGRRKALIYSVILMVIPTALLGLLPGTATLGLASPVIVLILRLLQGLAVGGELVGSMIYLREMAPQPEQRGFYASLSMFGVFAGILLGPVIILLCLSLISTPTFNAWGWRIPFCLSFIFGLVIYYMRRSLKESTEFTHHLKKVLQTRGPLLQCLVSHKIEILQVIGISSEVGIAFWITMVYITTYFTKIYHYPVRDIQMLNLLGILAALITVPIVGKLTKYIHARSILIVLSIVFILVEVPTHIIYTIEGVSLVTIFIFHILNSILVGAYIAAAPVQLCALFPTEIRYTGVGIGYNVALTLFGSTAPLVVTYLIEEKKLLYGMGIVVMSGAVLSLIAALTLNKKYVN